MKLLLGTTNPAKLESFKKYLKHSELDLVTLNEINIGDEPLETGESFEENALQKAKFYAQRSELPALADDGGFEIDALGGEPGVNSKRWVGPSGTDQDRIKKVFKKLEGIPQRERTARLKSVILIYFPDIREHISVSSSREGIIPDQPSKTAVKGYPYRSVLFLPEFGKFYADMTEEELAKTDHRKKACRELLLKLTPFINS